MASHFSTFIKLSIIQATRIDSRLSLSLSLSDSIINSLDFVRSLPLKGSCPVRQLELGKEGFWKRRT